MANCFNVRNLSLYINSREHSRRLNHCGLICPKIFHCAPDRFRLLAILFFKHGFGCSYGLQLVLLYIHPILDKGPSGASDRKTKLGGADGQNMCPQNCGHGMRTAVSGGIMEVDSKLENRSVDISEKLMNVWLTQSSSSGLPIPRTFWMNAVNFSGLPKSVNAWSTR
jgi:hypothetical protein